METIYEDKDELSSASPSSRLMRFFRSLRAATLDVPSCISAVLVILSVIVFTFTVLYDNILDAFYSISLQNESIASAYTQILSDLKFAFIIVGGLLGDCVYGRVPLLSSSFFVYSVTLSLSLFSIAFFSPPFYFLFAIVILSSFAYGVAIINAMTLLLNYASLKRDSKSLQLLFYVGVAIMISALASFLVRTFMHLTSFLAGFRILSVVSVILLTSTAKLVFSVRHHFINIPLQGNPVKEYSKAARVLSREYHYSLMSRDKDGGSDVLCRASNDFFNRSISHDSIDAIDGSPTILHSSSLDCYYMAQDVYVSSTSSLPSAISEVSDVNTFVLSNCDEPPSSKQTTRIKVLRPVRTKSITQRLLQSRREEETLREMAALFRNGIHTNLTGQIYRVSQALLFAGMQVLFWCIFEYSESVLFAQLSVLETVTAPSSFVLYLADCSGPASRFLFSALLVAGLHYARDRYPHRFTPLQLMGCGYAVLVVQLLAIASVNRFILLAQSSHLSIYLLLLPALLLVAAEVCVLYGSLLFFYQEAPRRSQAILLSLPFASRYCGSLLFYGVLPLLNAMCNVGTHTGTIVHYEIGLILQCVVTVILLALHVVVAMKYCYVTEVELDRECEALRADRILHPYLMKVDPEKKNRSKSVDSISRSSSRTSKSPRSISDEIVIMSKGIRLSGE